MSAKPETTYIALIHKRQIIKTTHKEKMHNPYRSGTPDCYYSGVKGELWVEYKYTTRIPIRANTEIVPDLSPQQEVWLESRYLEGRNVAVVLGSPEGGVIYRRMARFNPIFPAEFRRQMKSADDIAAWIFENVGAGACLSSLISTKRRAL